MIAFRSAVAVVGTLVAIGGCEPDPGGHSTSQSGTDRTVLQTEERWAYLSTVEDSLLLAPSDVEVMGGYVFVTDARGAAISVFALETGEPWGRFGRRGQGPGEFLEPLTLSAWRGDSVAILDPRRGAVLFANENGVGREVALVRPLGAAARGLCPTGDDGFVLARAGREEPIVAIDSLGRIVGTAHLPWPEYRSMPSPARRIRIAGEAGGTSGCSLAMYFGRGLAIYRGGSGERHADFVEDVPLPRFQVTEDEGGRFEGVVDRWTTGRDVARRDNRTVVLFGGLSERRDRLLDVYDGELDYLHSIELPDPSIRLALTDEGAIVVGWADGLFTLRYLTWSRTDPDGAD